jgi:hypothetical protein
LGSLNSRNIFFKAATISTWVGTSFSSSLLNLANAHARATCSRVGWCPLKDRSLANSANARSNGAGAAGFGDGGAVLGSGAGAVGFVGAGTVGAGAGRVAAGMVCGGGAGGCSERASGLGFGDIGAGPGGAWVRESAAGALIGGSVAGRRCIPGGSVNCRDAGVGAIASACGGKGAGRAAGLGICGGGSAGGAGGGGESPGSGCVTGVKTKGSSQVGQGTVIPVPSGGYSTA